MAGLISIPVPNLVSGVSQQPATLRLATSVDAMDNCWASVITGVSKRPPSTYLARLKDKFNSSVAGTIIDKTNEVLPIVVTIGDGDLHVHDINGNDKVVHFPEGKVYLSASDPAASFRFLNIQDTTFILNKEVKVLPRDFGELSSDDVMPDGQVYAFANLPDPDTLGKDIVYQTYSDGKFYKNVYHPAVTNNAKWTAISGIQNDEPTDGLPIVPTIRYNDGYGDGAIVWLKTDTVTTEKVTNYLWTGSYLYPYETTQQVTKSKYQKFQKSILSLSPSFFRWEEKTRQELADEVAANRWDPTHVASVYVAASAGNTRYNIYIDGMLAASFLTDTNVDAYHAMENTETIAKALCDGKIVADPAHPDDYSMNTRAERAYLTLEDSGFEWIRTGSTITITNFPAEGKILATSSQGDTLMKCCYNMVKQFSDLPPQSPHGRIIVVGGDIETGGDDYAVQYNTVTRQWEETYWYGKGCGLDPDTMPWVLIRNPDDSYTFKKHYWRQRPSGDGESNPHPRFVNEKINDIFLFTNRLGFITNNNLILSGAYHYEQFYKSTVATQQDDDRLDFIVATQNDDTLRHVVPFNRDLLIMADKTQYRFQYNQFVGPKNVQVAFTTSFNVAKHIQPVNMGLSMFFADDSSTYRYAKIFQYFPRPNNQGDDAEEVTEPVPAYIPSGVRFLASSVRTSMLFLSTKGDPNGLYVYKFFWAGDKKVQSCWNRWQFNDATSVYWAKINRNYLYLLIERGGGVYLERINIDEQTTYPDNSPDVYLDMRVSKDYLLTSYDGKYTTIQFPYTFVTTPNIVVSSTNLTDAVTGNEKWVSANLNTIKVSNNTVKVKGDVRDQYITGGIPYTMSFTISNPYVRTQAGSGQAAVLDGRLMVRWFNLEYHKATHFTAKVNLRGRPETVMRYDDIVASDFDTHFQKTSYKNGTFKIPVMGLNLDTSITIENSTPHNSSFGGGEWWAMHQPRTRRV